MVVSDTICVIDELTIALLTSDFVQVRARSNFGQRALQNRIRLWGKIGQDPTLNTVLYEIPYDFEQDMIRLWIAWCHLPILAQRAGNPLGHTVDP